MNHNLRVRIIGLLLMTVAIAGCSSITPQEAGYVLGALAGGAVGSAPGAAAGALLGTAAGSLIAKPIEAARERKERQGLEDRLNAPTMASTTTPPLETVPSAMSPQPLPHSSTMVSERIWIDEQVIDGRVIPGHFAERYVPAGEPHTTAGASPSARTVDAAAPPTL